MEKQHHPNNTSTPRSSKRSNTNLSNLRLAPLSTSFLANTGPHTDSSYNTHHNSYIQGRSAPSTPGILGRSSSRRQLGAGLSRKLSLYDTEAPTYAAVEVDRDGTPLHALRPGREPRHGVIPKAKSEAALPLAQRRLHPRLLASHNGGPLRHHQRSLTGGAGAKRTHHGNDDGGGVEGGGEDWLSRAAVATHALLRESKGQSWHSAAAALVEDDVSSDEEDEALRRLSASAHGLHYADDELSPETPRYASRWGSRFGSRAPSARNSRRGSRVDLSRTPAIAEAQEQEGGGYFARDVVERDEVVEPDFVDGEEGRGEDTTEDEIARLARDRSFGLGGLVDRLVGWTLFSVDEDREATDVEEDEEDAGARAITANAAARGMLQVQRPPAQDVQPEVQEEGGWHDAAWLLSLATKVIL